MGSFRQEYQSGLPFPPPGDFSDPGIKPPSFESPALAGRFFSTEPPGKPRDALINLKSLYRCTSLLETPEKSCTLHTQTHIHTYHRLSPGQKIGEKRMN